MLSHAIKLIYLFSLFFLISCKNEQAELQKKRELFQEKVISIVGHNEYYSIYNEAKDSINCWIVNNLDNYIDLKLNSWQIDSLIVMNTKRDKCIMTILKRATYFNKAVQDDIYYFNGVKINGKWYFFSGGTLVLPREYYQKDIHTPLSIGKMKELAMKHIYSTYLKKRGGVWEINENYFSDLTSVAWCSDCNTQAKWDSAYLAQVRLNWEKRDNKKYDPNE